MEGFEARYSGRCAAGDAIEPGQRVAYAEDGLTHLECLDQTTEPKDTKFQGTSLDQMGY